MKELDWDWSTICCVLMWKLAPNGVAISRQDLTRLPEDLVLLEDRQSDRITLSWVSLERARTMTQPILAGVKRETTVEPLGGRWQKIAVVLMWKLARDGVVLNQTDRDQVPADKQLLAHGHADAITYRFLPHAEAARIAAFARDNEGHIITERAAV